MMGEYTSTGAPSVMRRPVMPMLYTAGKVFLVDVTKNVPVFRSVFVDRHLDDAKIDKVGNLSGHDLGNALHGVLNVPLPTEPELVSVLLFSDFSRLNSRLAGVASVIAAGN